MSSEPLKSPVSVQLKLHIEKALQQLPEAKDPEAYVFKVSNLSDGTERRYRLNAHGHVKLII